MIKFKEYYDKTEELNKLLPLIEGCLSPLWQIIDRRFNEYLDDKIAGFKVANTFSQHMKRNLHLTGSNAIDFSLKICVLDRLKNEKEIETYRRVYGNDHHMVKSLTKTPAILEYINLLIDSNLDEQMWEKVDDYIASEDFKKGQGNRKEIFNPYPIAEKILINDLLGGF